MYYDYAVIDLEPTVTLAAYTGGDVVGGLLTFAVDGTSGPLRGVIRNLVMIDEDSEAEVYTLYLFSSQPSAIADAAPFAPTVADLRKLIGTVAIAAANYTTVNNFDYVEKTGIDLEFFAPNGSIYAYLVATDTPDYANADTLYFRLTVEVVRA